MDKLLEKFFDLSGWQNAIQKGVDKGIRHRYLSALCSEEIRKQIAVAIMSGKYDIAPPHIAEIPKDNGDKRIVYINEPVDRVVLSRINDLLFEECSSMVHPRCMSYLKGTGCGKVVRQISDSIANGGKGVVGFKADLSKYFDSVPISLIDNAFDEIERICGKSSVVDVLRKYYHSDLYFDLDGALQSKYQSLKQGCAPASFLADAVLYDLDAKMSQFKGVYVRYSDDILYIGADYQEAMTTMRTNLEAKGLTLNPKKVEYVDANHYVKFLGFNIKGKERTFTAKAIKTFQKEIMSRTVKRWKENITTQQAVNSVNRYLYKGYDNHSWATLMLPVVNVQSDIDTMNAFVMDCIRAVSTKKRKVGGLGCQPTLKVGVVARGKGQNVTANRQKTEQNIEGYYSLSCMRKALLTSRGVYDTLVRQM